MTEHLDKARLDDGMLSEVVEHGISIDNNASWDVTLMSYADDCGKKEPASVTYG